jgi:restriction endonuclease S subunit
LGKFGTQLNLNTDTVGSIKVGLPPLPEQIQIARFLDHETGKIDLLIEKQQELIALLKEKRQAVISHAVTKGLSPQAPLKDSGIEWLGQVPEHWEVFKSSHVFCSSPRNGLSPSASEGSGSLPAFSISAVRKGKVKISNHVKYALGTPAATKRFRVRKGDVLVVRGNGNLTMVGQAGIVVGNIPKFCIYPDILIRLSLDDSKVSTQYFVHAWNSPSSRTQIELRANTTNGTYKVASEAIKNIKIPVPPTAEQALIVKFLEERTSQFDSLLRTAETQITLLQERRTAPHLRRRHRQDQRPRLGATRRTGGLGMIIEGIKFREHPCFKDHWSGFDEIRPINLIIGKNNSGKSHLLQFVEMLCEKRVGEIQYPLKAVGLLDEDSLKSQFRSDTSGGDLGGNHWQNHGAHFTNQLLGWEKNLGAEGITFPDGFDISTGRVGGANTITRARQTVLQEVAKKAHTAIFQKQFHHLLADRDIRPEPTSNVVTLNSDGSGATNVVRRFLNSTNNQEYPRDLIRSEMLDALNKIFGEDGHFLEISIQHLDGDDKEKAEDLWEIYLAQEHKGLVALSESGSSLKTIFLVLLNILVTPYIAGPDLSGFVFAFEELENNLHPSLLRRLLEYLESFANKTGEDSITSQPTFFLTTHSNVALDYFAGREHAQIVHVSHDGKSGRTQTIAQTSKQLEVIRDLGSRASDLLQANGIIWVEGPSDRVYLNRWIELYSDEKLEEGRHYQCMFYGGGLLANLGVGFDDDEVSDLINLLKINPNAIVISDSDKPKKGSQLKERVRRIRDEFKELDPTHSFHWVLEAREIENYLTANLLRKTEPKTPASAADPGQYESFFPKKSESEKSYLEAKMKRKTFDKTELALITTPHMDKATMATRFDLDSSMTKVINLIKTWNR